MNSFPSAVCDLLRGFGHSLSPLAHGLDRLLRSFPNGFHCGVRRADSDVARFDRPLSHVVHVASPFRGSNVCRVSVVEYDAPLYFDVARAGSFAVSSRSMSWRAFFTA